MGVGEEVSCPFRVDEAKPVHNKPSARDELMARSLRGGCHHGTGPHSSSASTESKDIMKCKSRVSVVTLNTGTAERVFPFAFMLTCEAQVEGNSRKKQMFKITVNRERDMECFGPRLCTN